MMDVNIRKNIPRIVFHALSNGAIRIWLRCSGAEIYRFLLVHSRKNILYKKITQRDGHTDRQKDRQTDRQTNGESGLSTETRT